MPQQRTDNRFITIDGETKTLAEWEREYRPFGITRQLILGRIAAGWPEDEAVTKPPRKYGNNRNTTAGD